jgi:hypothetical protein
MMKKKCSNKQQHCCEHNFETRTAANVLLEESLPEITYCKQLQQGLGKTWNLCVAKQTRNFLRYISIYKLSKGWRNFGLRLHYDLLLLLLLLLSHL